jgi:GYF domain 2
MVAPGSEPSWYFVENGHIVGPVALAQLANALSTGLPAQTLVWSPFMPQWAPAIQVSVLAAALGRDVAAHDTFDTATANYWLGPFLTIREVFIYTRSMRRNWGFSRDDFLGSTWTAFCVFLLFIFLAVVVLDHEGAPAEASVARTVAAVLALLGTILPALFMVGATASRLQDVGEGRRGALLILLPGINLVLWLHLMMARGRSDGTSNAEKGGVRLRPR